MYHLLSEPSDQVGGATRHQGAGAVRRGLRRLKVLVAQRLELLVERHLKAPGQGGARHVRHHACSVSR